MYTYSLRRLQSVFYGSLVINAPIILGKQVSEVEKVLGPSKAVVTITSAPDWMPGEFRDYVVDGLREPLIIRYHNGIAVGLTAYFDEPSKSPEELLARIGINVNGSLPRVTAPMAKRWSGSFNKTHYSDVAALLSVPNTNDWDIAQAKIEN